MALPEVPAVTLALKLNLFYLATLLPWPLNFRPLNGVMGHQCHRSSNFQLATPFCFQLRVRYGTDRQRPSMLNATALWGRGHKNMTKLMQTTDEFSARDHSDHATLFLHFLYVYGTILCYKAKRDKNENTNVVQVRTSWNTVRGFCRFLLRQFPDESS